MGRLSSRREVLVELRTPVYQAVLGPIADGLAGDPRLNVWYTSEHPERIAPLVRRDRLLTHEDVGWRRFDAYINGDPWAAARLRRCAHRINFFHGVAGKYDLDSPGDLPLGFQYYSHVAFINRDRMDRYLRSGVVSPAQAVLVGYPKLDRLATGGYDAAATRRALGLAPGRPTALYAPTYSAAASLHAAGEAIVRALALVGFNVIVKLHDRSLDPDARYTDGIDWRARFAALASAQPSQVSFTETADASPLLAAADVMVTDHSSIGFEYLILDRPLVVFDAPDLERTARINPEKVALLRSAAAIARTADEAARAARQALADPGHQSAARRQIARDLFFDPGRATERALRLVRGVLYPGRAAERAPALASSGESS